MALSLINVRPLLFISYSREDAKIAEAINVALSTSCKTFFDKKSILIGDVFPERIITHLKKCDGCVALISASSIQSEWCKLELYYAHLLNKPIIPLKLGDADFTSGSPLSNLQKNINYTLLHSVDEVPATIELIQDRLNTTRKNAGRRFLRRAFLVAVIALLVPGGFFFAVTHLNGIKYARDKEALIGNIKSSNKILREVETEAYKKAFPNDQELVAALHLLESDPGLNDAARINAKILSSALLQSFNLAQRQSFQNIDWVLSLLANAQLANATFLNGFIKETNFRNVVFSDVYFNGLLADKKGIRLSLSRFDNCSFNAVVFDQTELIDVAFTNCRFRGSALDITNFNVVRFASKPDSTPVIGNGQVTYFENCVFSNTNPPDEKGVINLGADEEVHFNGVVFKGCRFTGLVRAGWFKDSSFDDCVFPASFDLRTIGINK